MVLIGDIDTWPPKFLTYEDFKNELNNAIEQHPPFGDFVKRKIVGNSELDKIIRLPNWRNFLRDFKSIKHLKEKYVEFKCRELNDNYSEIYCAETTLNLLDNDKYISDKEEYELKIQNIKSNNEAKKSEIITCKEFCEKRIEELSKII
jgi:hypothetical protein